MNPAIDHTGFTVSQTAPFHAFVFTDIVGSTELVEQLGDRRFAALLERHNAVVSELAADHGGRQAHFLGDGFLVVLPHGRAALAFAAALQAAIATLRERLELPLRVRIGINAGTAQVAGDALVGRNVILARRLCEQARADEILVSARLCEDGGTFGAVHVRRFKGMLGSEAACTLSWC
jgi:class 3 adenylate cyclase